MLTAARHGDITTLMGGQDDRRRFLIGGTLAVEILQRYSVGERRSTGRSVRAAALCRSSRSAGIGSAHEDCSDRTYGAETLLPWGVDFGDGVRRHPTQLYEILFVLVLGLSVRRAARQPDPSPERPPVQVSSCSRICLFPAGHRLHQAGRFVRRFIVDSMGERRRRGVLRHRADAVTVPARSCGGTTVR